MIILNCKQSSGICAKTKPSLRSAYPSFPNAMIILFPQLLNVQNQHAHFMLITKRNLCWSTLKNRELLTISFSGITEMSSPSFCSFLPFCALRIFANMCKNADFPSENAVFESCYPIFAAHFSCRKPLLKKLTHDVIFVTHDDNFAALEAVFLKCWNSGF